MKKSTPTKKPIKKDAPKPAAPAASKPLLTAQPQSKQQAAVAAGIFLQTNDTWSQSYFNPADLHFLERKLFG